MNDINDINLTYQSDWQRARALRAGKKLVFTNGVFDLLHAGHVTYLAAAASMGDILIVGVNDDASVRRLNKGSERPLNKLADRCTVLNALRAVAMAVPFADDTPMALIDFLRPEIHVKGGDYSVDQLPEAELIHAYGGKVEIIPLLAGRSTTALVKKIFASADKQ